MYITLEGGLCKAVEWILTKIPRLRDRDAHEARVSKVVYKPLFEPGVSNPLGFVGIGGEIHIYAQVPRNGGMGSLYIMKWRCSVQVTLTQCVSHTLGS